MVVNRLPRQTTNGNRIQTPAVDGQPSSTGRLLKTVEHLITNYPQVAVGTAVLCGVLLGCIIKRR
jgi:ElaB/YqjD/DUF883 family membrane-anchored ribosome-binding protein